MIKDKIYKLMKNSNVILDDDVLNFGLNIFITYLKYLTFIIPLSILLGELIEVFLFLIFFIPIRRFIGGFHFDNLNYCFIGSVILAVILPYIAKNILIPSILVFEIIILTIIITAYIGAVDHRNKKLAKDEKKTY